jgi:Fic family protein
MFSPKFSISNKILRDIGEIEAAKEVIENAPLVPSFEKQFQSDAVVRTVHHGTHIEGNDLTLMQTRKVLEGEAVVARARDIQEVINYRNVVELLDELAFKRGDYDIDTLKDIQKVSVTKIVADDKLGVFRRSQVVIKNEETGEVILHPPAFVEVPYLIEDFMEWLNSNEVKEIHPIILAGITHYLLVAIHPFVEGNGRTARAFATLTLIKQGYDIKKFFSFEEHFDEDPASYYEALSQVDKQSSIISQRDLTPWLEYFTQVVSVELGKIKEKVKKLSMDSRLKLRIGSQVALSERQMRLVEFVSDRGSAGMRELKSVLRMVSEDTILRDLRDLLGKGIIKKEGSTKASRYVIASK